MSTKTATTTYLRTHGTTRSDARLFGPKPADHPSVGNICPACETEFVPGDYTTLVALGPGADEDARRRAMCGMFYTAVAIELHWSCATGHPAPSTRSESPAPASRGEDD